MTYDISEIMERTKKFSESENGLLIQIRDIKEYSCNMRSLKSFGLPDNMKEYLDYSVDYNLEYLNKRSNIKDDFLPSMTAWYGIAEHSAFVGGEVDFSIATSWHHQVINDYCEMNKLSLNPNNKYLRLVLDGLEYLKEIANDRFLVKLRGADGPMDIANIVRGNDIFYDFYDEAENVKKLMDFCTDATLFTLKKQEEIVGSIDNGVLNGFNIWMPGKATGHLSEDASTMISKNHFNEFCKPYTEKVCKGYDNVFMHTHSLGIHNIGNIASINNINYMEISNDPNAKRSIEVYKELYSLLKDKTIILTMNRDEILANLELLSDNKIILWYYAENEKDANEIISIARGL